MAIVPHSAEIRRHSSAQHQALVREITRGRPDAARKVMSEHLAATESFLRGLLADVRSDAEADGPTSPAATLA
jgi:DNA-binding FadR family transcriptional regulator